MPLEVIFVDEEGLEWIMDPLRHYPSVYLGDLMAMLGYLPSFITPRDPRPALEQFRERYRFGVDELKGCVFSEGGVYQYPGDPPQYPIASVILHNEQIFFYPHAFVAIKSPDGSYYMTRMD